MMTAQRPPQHLLDAAKKAASGSYSPYSKFVVAAAIETDIGVFTGANVENASYGLAICAERAATFTAVNCGAKAISSVVVYVPKKTIIATPCGACRQVLREFPALSEQDGYLRIWCVNDSDQVVATTLRDLLPHSFGPDALDKP